MADFKNILPTPEETNVPRTSAINFTILNDAYGAKINTLSSIVNNTKAINNGSFINGFSGQIISGVNLWVVTIYPKDPIFFPRASLINVSIDILDSYNNHNAYSWSFSTAGYIPPGSPEPDPPGGPIPSEPITRACLTGNPFFIYNEVGLNAAFDKGIGTEIELNWKTASPNDENNFVVYNIYLSTYRISVFDSPPKFLSTSLSALIGGIPPGNTYFFAVRAAEVDPDISTLTGLQQIGNDLFRYPSTTLDGYIADGYTTINVKSTNGFPANGIILINDELIKYNSIQLFPPAFITDVYGRGWESTIAEQHLDNTDVFLYRGREDGNTVIAQATPTFQKPNTALTYVLGDGYGPDGYRDGYDGYAKTDGYYFPKQVKNNDITTQIEKSHDQNDNFPSFDYCGTWRKLSPENLWTGKCVGSYFGGIQYRNGTFVRENNIQSHMLQREELMLSSTGEPFVLLRRKWTGIRCSCHMLRREHADKRCPQCFGTGFQNGYEQFVNPRRPDGRILVRVDPTTEDLKIEDKGGLTPDYIPSAWTIAFPGLRDRDALIRFNEDNTEEFRYMILNVDRVKAFFGQPGAQKFRMQRFHKTDVIYQFPTQRDMSPFPTMIETSISSGPGIPAHKHSLYVPSGMILQNIYSVTIVEERHSHVVKNGKILPALGHVHTI